jgi:hypothetical protein
VGLRGDGYGSEDHLRRYLDIRRGRLNNVVSSVVGVGAEEISWLPFLETKSGDREYRGIEFLDRSAHEHAYESWRDFWPTTGRRPSWDAVGRVGNEWLLVEAKANAPEFCSPSSAASPESRKKIVASLNKTKRALGVHRFFAWDGTYYQYTNRLTVLHFLREHGVRAHLIGLYFTGDRFPDNTPCPRTSADWNALLEARRLTLGLPKRHRLSRFDHHVFLPALKPPDSKLAQAKESMIALANRSSDDWVASSLIHSKLRAELSDGMFGRVKAELHIPHRRGRGANGKPEYQWNLGVLKA